MSIADSGILTPRCYRGAQWDQHLAGGVRRSAQHALLLPRDGHRHNTTAHGGSNSSLFTNFLMILFS